MYNDWRDQLVEVRRDDLGNGFVFRQFQPFLLGEGRLVMSTQNGPTAYVSGRYLFGAPPFDFDALEDFEIAFWWDGEEEERPFLNPTSEPILMNILDAAGVEYDDSDVIGYVPHDRVAYLIERFGGIRGLLPRREEN